MLSEFHVTLNSSSFLFLLDWIRRWMTDYSGRKQRKKAVRSQGTATVEEDPDPWVRKARSTSKKHGREVGRYGGSSRRNSSRPVTAPARPLVLRRPSTSSLSAVAYSGSSSASSPVIDRLDYRLSREEPVQHSRGARRLKKRHKNQPPSSIISDQPGPSSRTKKKKSSRKSKDPQPDVGYSLAVEKW